MLITNFEIKFEASRKDHSRKSQYVIKWLAGECSQIAAIKTGIRSKI